jgi:predicted lipid carrier protein YhbT
MIEPHVKKLIGHKGYLSSHYDRYTEEEMRDAYLKAEYTVSLSATVDTEKMVEQKKAIDALSSENTRMLVALSVQKQESDDLKAQLELQVKGQMDYEQVVNERLDSYEKGRKALETYVASK